MLGLGFGISHNNGRGSADLTSLFENGGDGFLFDGFSDTAKLFQAGTGGNNISTDGQTVALGFESSIWRSNETLTTIASDAPQLLLDPGFDDASKWALTQATVAGSLMTLNSPTGSYAGGIQNMTGLTIGDWFELTAQINSITRGNPTLGWGGGLAAVTGAGVGLAKGYLPTIVTNPIWELKRNLVVDTLLDASSAGLKRIKGNHFNQGTAANRPTWRTGPKPYLEFDGVNDSLLTPKWKPAGAATVAVACRHNAVATGAALAGGSAAGNKRLRLSLSATGRAELAYNAQFQNFGGPSKLGQDIVMIATYDAAGADFYVDGVLMGTIVEAPAMDGFGDTTSLGAIGGGASNFWSGNLYGALALSRRVTPSEVNLINNTLRNRIP